MKKRIALVTVLLILVAFTTACTGSAPAASSAAAPAKEGDAPAAAADSGEPIRIRMSTVQMEQQQQGIAMANLAAKLEERLGDRVEVQTYPGAQLYTGPEEMTAITNNEVQIGFVQGGALETISESIAVIKLPYLFSSLENGYATMEGPLGDEIYKPVRDAGIDILSICSAGLPAIANDKQPLKLPADFVGLKMRTPSTADTMLFEHLGASTMTTPSEETYTAVTTGLIDGMTTPCNVFMDRKFFEVQSYVTDAGMIASMTIYIVGNTEWLAGLPEDVRTEVLAAIEDVEVEMRADIVAASENYWTEFEELGVEVYHLNETEIQAWKDVTAPIYDLVAEDLGQDLVDLAVTEAAKG